MSQSASSTVSLPMLLHFPTEATVLRDEYFF